MPIMRYVADVASVREDSEAFKVCRLAEAGTNNPAPSLLDPTATYADRDALQVALAGKLHVEYPAIRVDVRDDDPD